MKMKYTVFIGIDISKKTIDVSARNGQQFRCHKQFINNAKGFRSMFTWVKANFDYEPIEWLFCMEFSGVYVLPLAKFLFELKLNYCIENPYHLKHSIGLQRGKSDKIDAYRIADYVARNYDRVRLHNFPGEIILKLQALLAFRQRLVKIKAMLKVPAGELVKFCPNDISSTIQKGSNNLATSIDRQIKKLEKQIMEVLKLDPKVEQNFNLAISVKGIGPVIATSMIVYTQNFNAITDSRKFASYSGIAPFEHSSGSSVYKKPGVSHLANKKMKSLLGSAALNAIRFDKEIKAYYERKIAEGKNKHCVINAVKNKLVSRVFSVVKRGTPYVNLGNYRS